MDESVREAGADLIAWYRAMGVTDLVQETPVDWLARGPTAPGAGFAIEGLPEPAAPQRPAAPVQSARPIDGQRAPAGGTPMRPAPAAAPRQFPTAPPDEAVMAARSAAADAATLEALETTLAGFNGCTLKATAKHLCFYRGAAKSRVMMIGEAPGRDEDLEGKPFVGRSGQLLDRMLAAIGLTDADVHITNVVYWRPPGNRTPTPQETLVCRPFLERQVALVEPEIVVLLGGAAAKQILGVEDGIMRLRGKWRDIEIGGRSLKALATLHPAYLLRTPAQKRLAWRDLLMLSAVLRS